MLSGLLPNKNVVGSDVAHATNADDRETGEGTLCFLGPRPSRGGAEVSLLLFPWQAWSPAASTSKLNDGPNE